MSGRTKKISKNAQMEFLQDKLDEFAEAMYWVNQYFQEYDLDRHWKAWVKAKAEGTELPKVLIIQQDETKAEVIEDGESNDNNTDS